MGEGPRSGDPGDRDDGDIAAAAAAAALRRATRGASRRATPRRLQRSRGSAGDIRDPQPLGEALNRLMAEQGWEQRSAVAVLMTEWAQIVGPDLAEHVQPATFAEGVLTLRADSTAWATQVRLLLPQVHRAVDAKVGVGVVTRITIAGPQAPSWVAGPRRVAGRGPRDTYG